MYPILAGGAGLTVDGIGGNGDEARPIWVTLSEGLGELGG